MVFCNTFGHKCSQNTGNNISENLDFEIFQGGASPYRPGVVDPCFRISWIRSCFLLRDARIISYKTLWPLGDFKPRCWSL